MKKSHGIFVFCRNERKEKAFWQLSRQNKRQTLPLAVSEFDKGKTAEKKPFFSMLSQSGTLKFFVDALEKRNETEARRYLSKMVAGSVNLEEAYELFHSKNQYKYLFSFRQEKKSGVSTVSIAIGKNEEIVHVKMVEEPDNHGIWKIIRIEKEC